jgi:hypothetical protein
MKRISLTKGKFAIVDDCDYEYLMQWRWCLHNGGYACRRRGESDEVGSQIILMHRVIAGRMELCVQGLEVDHKDINDPYNKLNNQRNNLRVATSSQNKANHKLQSNNTTKFTGVSNVSGYKNRFRAYLNYLGKQIHLGCYDTVKRSGDCKGLKGKRTSRSICLNELQGTLRNIKERV